MTLTKYKASVLSIFPYLSLSRSLSFHVNNSKAAFKSTQHAISTAGIVCHYDQKLPNLSSCIIIHKQQHRRRKPTSDQITENCIESIIDTSFLSHYSIEIPKCTLHREVKVRITDYGTRLDGGVPSRGAHRPIAWRVRKQTRSTCISVQQLETDFQIKQKETVNKNRKRIF